MKLRNRTGIAGFGSDLPGSGPGCDSGLGLPRDVAAEDAGDPGNAQVTLVISKECGLGAVACRDNQSPITIKALQEIGQAFGIAGIDLPAQLKRSIIRAVVAGLGPMKSTGRPAASKR